MNHLVHNNPIMPNRKTCRVASVAYSFLLLSSDLCNNSVISGFAGTPGYTQKISLDCDEHHHLPQTQGTSLSEKICFLFSPINSHQKSTKEKRYAIPFVVDIWSYSFLVSFHSYYFLLFCSILHHAVVHTNLISHFFPLSIASAQENKLFDL